MTPQPILAVVIPTRNRAETAVLAIRNALSVSDRDDIEVLVHDCGDDDTLATQIPCFNDRRLKYFKVQQTNMTDNWNQALQKVQSKYVIFIGDDDALLPTVLQVARWADADNIESVTFPRKAFYSWPGLASRNSLGCLTWSKFSGCATQASVDLCKLTVPYYFYQLPQLYYGLIRYDLVLQLIERTGRCLDSYCPDIYAAYAFSFLTKKHFQVDYPCVIIGTSPRSNSNKVSSGANGAGTHFNEYGTSSSKSVLLPDFVMDFFIPSQYFYQSLVAVYDSFKVADGERVLNLQNLYADCFYRLSLNRKIKIIKRFYSLGLSKKEHMKLWFAIIRRYFEKVKSIVVALVLPIRKPIQQQSYCGDILCAVSVLKNRLRSLSLK